MRPLRHFLALAFLLTSCVSLDQLPPGSVPAQNTTTKADTTYADPDTGFATVTGSHFTLKGSSQSEMEALKNTAESIFSQIGTEIGLYTFLASQQITIIAYKDRDEYLKKTQQPDWSQATSTNKTIYLYYPNPTLDPVLAHHISHLILRSYLGDRLTNLKWLDEGLAMHVEVARLSTSERLTYDNSKSTQLREKRMAFSQMSFFVTNSEELRRTDPWFQQTESVVTYLLAQGSPLAFAQFLSELRVVEVDQSIADAYPGKFRSFADLEAAWKYTI